MFWVAAKRAFALLYAMLTGRAAHESLWVNSRFVFFVFHICPFVASIIPERVLVSRPKFAKLVLVFPVGIEVAILAVKVGLLAVNLFGLDLNHVPQGVLGVKVFVWVLHLVHHVNSMPQK